jgi:hypothetical protein
MRENKKHVSAPGYLVAMAITCAGVLSADAAWAQGPVDVYAVGSVGRGGYPVLESGASEFNGPKFVGGAGLEILGHVLVEGSYDRLNYRRNDWDGWNGTATAVLGRVGYRFGASERRVRPFAAAVFGHMDDAWHYPPYLEKDGPQRREEQRFNLRGAAAGVDVRLPARFFVRPEFAFAVGEGNAYVGTTVGLGFRF